MPVRYYSTSLAILLITNVLIGIGLSADEEQPTVEESISQALLDTQKGRRVTYPPKEEVVEQYRNGAQSDIGETWGFSQQQKIDDQNSLKTVSITVLPEDYKPDAAKEASFSKYELDIKPKPEWGVAYRTAKRGSVVRTQITYRMIMGRYRLMMTVRVGGEMSSAKALEKTRGEFELFYDLTKKRLGEPIKPQILATITEPFADDPAEVENGQVFSVDNDKNVDVRALFDVWAIAEFLKPQDPYSLRLKVIKRRGGKGISVRGPSLSNEDSEGWRQLKIANSGAVGKIEVNLERFKTPTNPKQPRDTDRLVEIVVQLLSPKDGKSLAEFRFGLQRRDWVPIVQRFQLVGRNYRARGADGKEVSSLVPKPERMSFNDYLDQGGTLLQNYRTLVGPIATRFDKLKSEEIVCLGWRADNLEVKQMTDFLAAVDDPKVKQKLPVLIEGTGVRHLIDIRIWRAPKIESLDISTADLGDLDDLLDGDDGLDEPQDPNEDDGDLDDIFGDLDIDGDIDDLDDDFLSDDFLEGFDDLFVDPDKEELKTRNDLYIKSYSLTIEPIEFTPAGENDVDFMMNLPARLRKAPTGKDIRIIPPAKLQAFTKLEDHLPLADRYKDPREFPDSKLTTRNSGVFLLRLRAELYHVGATANEAKSVEVAIRYAIAPVDFKLDLLNWQMRRMRLGSRKPEKP
jgi:hypothetical protein